MLIPFSVHNPPPPLPPLKSNIVEGWGSSTRTVINIPQSHTALNYTACEDFYKADEV